jgi:hypothetical protein
MLNDIDLGSDFISMTPNAQAINKKTRLHQTKKLHNKGNHQHSEKHPMEWEKIFANYISEKKAKSKIYKEFITLQ